MGAAFNTFLAVVLAALHSGAAPTARATPTTTGKTGQPKRATHLRARTARFHVTIKRANLRLDSNGTVWIVVKVDKKLPKPLESVQVDVDDLGSSTGASQQTGTLCYTTVDDVPGRFSIVVGQRVSVAVFVRGRQVGSTYSTLKSLKSNPDDRKVFASMGCTTHHG